MVPFRCEIRKSPPQAPRRRRRKFCGFSGFKHDFLTFSSPRHTSRITEKFAVSAVSNTRFYDITAVIAHVFRSHEPVLQTHRWIVYNTNLQWSTACYLSCKLEQLTSRANARAKQYIWKSSRRSNLSLSSMSTVRSNHHTESLAAHSSNTVVVAGAYSTDTGSRCLMEHCNQSLPGRYL